MFYEAGINYYNVDSDYLKTRHAEVDVLQKLKAIKIKKKLKKINLLVYRTNKKGNSLMMAKPCINCLNYYKKNIRKKGYKLNRIYYTSMNGLIKYIKLK